MNWEIKDGKRVPKGTRQINADGSWREEIRQGNCVTIKEKSAAGEYKEIAHAATERLPSPRYFRPNSSSPVPPSVPG